MLLVTKGPGNTERKLEIYLASKLSTQAKQGARERASDGLLSRAALA